VARALLTVDFWDVGQADCSVIELPDSSLVIIDVARKSGPLIEWLQRRTNPIRAIVLTHNHDDHAGAMPSIVHQFKQRIGTVFMLKDVDKSDAVFAKIFRPIAEAYHAGFFDVQPLDKGRRIAGDNSIGLQIEAAYPHFVGANEAKDRNEYSGIIRLRLNGATEVIWAGDTLLRLLAENCSGEEPSVLAGPHHGAPKDTDHIDATTWIRSVGSKRGFISVGSNNNHSHPKARYLQALRSQGCRVICSQITDRCDPDAAITGRPIIPSHGLLGLSPQRKGTACRGAFRLELRNGALVADKWDSEHLRRISSLAHPQCILRKPSGTVSARVVKRL
jgi:beta-lactamase superfamily II metal-dependent hydrolase